MSPHGDGTCTQQLAIETELSGYLRGVDVIGIPPKKWTPSN